MKRIALKQFRMLVVCLLLLSLSSMAVSAEEPTVSMMFVQDDLRDAITELMLQTGVNIIMDDSVYGLVTLDLVDVPLEQALRMMALPGGYEVYKIDDFYFIGSSNPASLSFRTFARTETYRLKYVTSEEVIDLIPNVYTPYVKAGLNSNGITITAPPSVTEQILQLLGSSINLLPRSGSGVGHEISRSELEEWGAGS